LCHYINKLQNNAFFISFKEHKNTKYKFCRTYRNCCEASYTQSAAQSGQSMTVDIDINSQLSCPSDFHHKRCTHQITTKQTY